MGHFKRECRNYEVDGTANPFKDDYYQKAIYHRSREESPRLKQIENNSEKEKSRACVVIQDDE
ncbi:hypothetical protein Hanom_Chr06g00529181 [Helianthus anomalus]